MATTKKTTKTITKPTLWSALSNFQNEMPILHQGSKAHSYTYTDLKTIIEVATPILHKHGLVVNSKLEGTGMITRLTHIPSGEFDESKVELPQVELRGMNSAQSMGAIITYFRRYSISCMLNLISDADIDASGETKKTKSVYKSNAKKICNQKDWERIMEKYGQTFGGQIIDHVWIVERYTLTPSQQKELKEVMNG